MYKSTLNQSPQNKQSKPHILMLAPNDPDSDPRIKWVIDLCLKVSNVDVFGYWPITEKPSREYDGTIYLERVHPNDYEGKNNDFFTLWFYRQELLSRHLSNFASQITFILSMLGLSALVYGVKYIMVFISSVTPGNIYLSMYKLARNILVRFGWLDHYKAFRKSMTEKYVNILSNLENTFHALYFQIRKVLAKFSRLNNYVYRAIRTQIRKILIRLGWLDHYRSYRKQVQLIWHEGLNYIPLLLRTIKPKWKLVIITPFLAIGLVVAAPFLTIGITVASIRRGIKKSSLALSNMRISVQHFYQCWRLYKIIIDALYLRARAVSIPPHIIICHDVFALAAGVKLKKIFKVPIIYDSHEFWQEVDLVAKPWENKFMACFERKIIRQADAVITVSPLIAHAMEHSYHLKDVICVPNAEPIYHGISPSSERPLSFPLQFLFQGGIAPGRGIDKLLEAWSQLGDERAILIIRAPENGYYSALRARFKKCVDDGRILFAPAVTESELVSAASSADVGIIPYIGPSLNHIYCCPNKLSQYMHAGLAILSNAELEFVSKTIASALCGQTYQAENPQSLVDSVLFWLDHPEQLIQMKKNAFTYARTTFNWEIQSLPYSKIIQDLMK